MERIEHPVIKKNSKNVLDCIEFISNWCTKSSHLDNRVGSKFKLQQGASNSLTWGDFQWTYLH